MAADVAAASLQESRPTLLPERCHDTDDELARHHLQERFVDVPEWLDQSIEACHADLPLAILSAFVAARQVTAPLDKTSVPTVRRERTQLYEPVCCDNFA